MIPIPASVLLAGLRPVVDCARLHGLEEGLGSLHARLLAVARILDNTLVPGLAAEVRGRDRGSRICS